MAQGVCELLCLYKVLEELSCLKKEELCLYFRYKDAVIIAYNIGQHDQTKHVIIDRHFIKEKVTNGTLSLLHVLSEKQLADMLTKGLNKKKFIL